MISLCGTKPKPLVVQTVCGWKWRAPTAGVALMAGAMMLIATAAQAKLPICSATMGITQCCRITEWGDYWLANSVTVPSTSGGSACIKITASRVILNGGGGYSLTGNNGTGIGIWLLPTAVGDVVTNFRGSISAFKTGILDDAPRSVIFGSSALSVQGNSGNGIVIRANRVYLTDIDSTANGGNGVVVKPLAPASMVSNVYLADVTAQGNANAGFLLESLSGLTSAYCDAISNTGDGVDLMNSVNSTFAEGLSNDNEGDGVKVVGGHGDIVNNDMLGVTATNSSAPNANGLVVRNSVFDTIDDDNASYNTGDGVRIAKGKGEHVANATVVGNGGSGIHLKRTTSSRVQQGKLFDNGGAGIWLDGSRKVIVWGVTSENNGKTDVYIGCSTQQLPDSTTCASAGLPASNGNLVTQGSLNNNLGITLFGIGIDMGDFHNRIFQNVVSGDTRNDLWDQNGCVSNVWMLNGSILYGAGWPCE